MNQRKAISKINKAGVLLVFPINNKPDPRSLWSEFFSGQKMRWEWDDGGDDKVGEMWRLMKRLSDCRTVVYSKWYQGRATFFSRDVFAAMLAILQKQSQGERRGDLTLGLPHSSKILLETLQNDSPLSTKELKKLTDLQGRDNEPEYNRGMKNLFSRLLIVAFGEVEDGAFPSLAIGSTQLIYEDLWNESQRLSEEAAGSVLDRAMPKGSHFRRYFEKVANEVRETQSWNG